MTARRTTRRKPFKVAIVSGGTGRTGRQVVESALAQFHDPRVEIIVKPRVRSSQAALRLVDWAAGQQAVICHTLVQPELREAVSRACHLRNVECVDLLGPMISMLADHVDGEPRNQPGLAYEVNKEQFDRIDAVDFTLAHDDGIRVNDLDRADVVLVGVSRVSKSVTCFFLACRGIRAANVPLVLGTEPPPELFQLDSNQVMGLMMNPHRLQHLREARGGAIGAAGLTQYTNLRHIAKELRYAQSLMNQYNWNGMDVSYMAVEEVASEIIARLDGVLAPSR